MYIQGDHYLLQTFRRETHVIMQSLSEVEELDHRQFFRINRQFIVNYKLCKGFRPVENGRLELELGPPVDGKRFVSRDKAQGFREWMER